MKKSGGKEATWAAVFFLVSLVVLFVILELLMSVFNPVGALPVFPKNDFEKTVAANGSSDFDRIFYGGSNVFAAYIESSSTSGYVDFGLEYGKVIYLLTMLEDGYITVSDGIVLGLNYFTFMDALTTNPGYIWHRDDFELYSLFYQNRIKNFFTGAVDNIINGRFHIDLYDDIDKTRFYGVWTEERLERRIANHERLYWQLQLSAFEGNLAAFRQLVDYCEENDIRLRAVWMPYSPYSPVPDIYIELMTVVNALMTAHGIDFIDMTNSFPQEYFLDLSHMNYDIGAVAFTREIDLWLAS